MQDDREDVGGRDIFVHESFHLGHSLLLCGRLPVIWRMVVLETEITETNEGFTATWVINAAVGGGEKR